MQRFKDRHVSADFLSKGKEKAQYLTGSDKKDKLWQWLMLDENFLKSVFHKHHRVKVVGYNCQEECTQKLASFLSQLKPTLDETFDIALKAFFAFICGRGAFFSTIALSYCKEWIIY